MFIKLDFKSETLKAYQLNNNSWVPKSILTNQGLSHPYYKIEDWWLNKSIKNMYSDKRIYDCLKGLEPLVIKLNQLPKPIIDKYRKYWKDKCDNLTPIYYDIEPGMWGNDCYEREH